MSGNDEMRAALDELADAFPVEDVSPGPWVVERGSIAWVVREGPGGPQIGNFILEADARFVADCRNADEASQPVLREALDVERLARASMLYEDRQRVYPRTSDTPSTIDHFMAQGIAAEYDRLAHPTNSPEEKE